MKNRVMLPGKKALPWLIAMALGITGAGAAIGTVLSGNVTGTMPTAVSQAIVIDKDNFDIGDLSSHAARRFVGVSDDATSFIAAAEISTGEELVINLPLGNTSEQDALALFTVDAPSPLQVYVREFWDTVTKTDTPTVHAQLTTPSPAPITATLPQTYDTDPNVTNSQPSGSVTIDANPENTSATTSQPSGTPSIFAYPVDTSSTNGQPSGTPTPSAQSVSAGAGAKPVGASGEVGTWTNSTVDDGGGDDVGYYTSIAVDPSNDQNLFISYYNDSNSNLEFAGSTDGGSSWSYSIIDPAAGVGHYSSIAAYDATKLFVSYHDWLGNDLEFAKSTDGGATWTPSTVDSDPGVGYYTSIAVDPTDAQNLFISYFDTVTSQVKFAGSTNGGTTWPTKVTVDSVGPALVYTSIDAVDSNNVFISYYDMTNGTLKFAKSTNGGATWPTIVTVDGGGLDNVGAYSSIDAIDTSNLFISYYDIGNGALKFAKSNDGGATWPTIVTVDDGGGDDVGFDTSIDAVDTSNIFISYWDSTNDDLKFAKSTDGGATWTTSAIDTTGDVGRDTSIAAFDVDTIYISHYDFTNGALKLAKFEGWDTSTVDSVGWVGWFTSIDAVDTSNLFISYYDDSNGDLKFAKSTDGGTTWPALDIVTVDDGGGDDIGLSTSIDAVDTDNIFISYWDGTNDDLKFAGSSDGGSSWATSTVDPGGDVGPQTSIAAVDTDNIFISYYDWGSDDLEFAKSDDGGSSWTLSTVDSVGEVGYATSIAAVDLDNLFISYSSWDSMKPLNDDLKFAKSSDGGATWTISTVDSVGWVGSFTSIAAVDSISVFISYSSYDGIDYDLKFAKLDVISLYYPATFTIDTDGDGATDTVDVVLIDLDADTDIDRVELSSDDDTFGEGTLTDLATGSDDDELFDAGGGASTSQDITLETYLFTITFQHSLSGLNAVVSATAKTWYTGTATIDLDADGNDDDDVDVCLTDTDSDGLYDTLGISIDGTGWGTGTLDDSSATAGDDERLDSSHPKFPTPYETIKLGSYYSFDFEFDNNPPDDNSDVRLTSSTWYTGTFTIDLDADANDDDDVDFCLTDTDSDGLYDTLDISIDGAGWGTGTLDDSSATAGDDERLDSSHPEHPARYENIQLGPYYTFEFDFDSNPPNDSDDARIYSQTWYTGDFTIDADGDQVADNTVHFALSDKTSDGLYDRIDLSTDGDFYGEGLGNAATGLAGSNDDELVSWSDDGSVVKLGYHYFLVEFDKNPPWPGNTDDARITSRWYVGTYNIDIDGDQIDNVLDYVFVDPGISEGLYTIINLDCNDSGHYTTSSPDEEFSTGDMPDLDGQIVQITFPWNATTITLTDGRIITVTRRNENQWLLLVPASADVGGEQDQIEIKIAHPDDADPGFFKVTGVLEPY